MIISISQNNTALGLFLIKAEDIPKILEYLLRKRNNFIIHNGNFRQNMLKF